MFYSFKEKSWSVLLVKGYVLNDQVRAVRCENCKSKTEVLTSNFNNPNLLLYGCQDNKCRHRFVRLAFEGQPSLIVEDNVKVPVSG
jgi:hypothetical protein